MDSVIDTLSKLGISLRDASGEVRNISYVMKDLENACEKLNKFNNSPLIQIELEDENSIPKVFYKGEEVTGKINISFSWDAQDSYTRGGLSYAIENVDKDNVVNRIERRTKDHR